MKSTVSPCLVPFGIQTRYLQWLTLRSQRRTIATLSKFVLSARAVLNNAPWDVGESSNQLSLDAEELERAVIDFVSIAGRDVCGESHGDMGQRRLHGHLTASHPGLGKAGAGAAGTWKGFGCQSRWERRGAQAKS